METYREDFGNTDESIVQFIYRSLDKPPLEISDVMKMLKKQEMVLVYDK